MSDDKLKEIAERLAGDWVDVGLLDDGEAAIFAALQQARELGREEERKAPRQSSRGHVKTYSMLEDERCLCGLAWPCPDARSSQGSEKPGCGCSPYDAGCTHRWGSEKP